MSHQETKTSDALTGLDELDEGIGKLAQEQLAYFRELHSRERPLTEATLWIHVVHGTWANPDDSTVRPTWSEPGGSLERALRSSVGSDQLKNVRFATVPPWSGRNSFSARHRAIQNLREYFRKVLQDPGKTFGRHLVIAHSHGGTVAAEALRDIGPLAREFSGLLTLGTPFVQRVRAFEPANEISFDTLTGLFAPAVALFFSLTLAIAFALEQLFWLAGLWLVYAFIPAIMCRIKKISGVGWALSAVTPPLALVCFWLALGGQDFGELLVCSLTSAFVTVFLGPKVTVTLRTLSVPADSEEQLPRPLQLPLLALRVPGDEASLAISAAAGAVFVSDAIRGAGLKFYTSIPERWRVILSWGVGLGAIAGLILALEWPDAWPAARYVRIAGRIAFAGPIIAIAFTMVMTLTIKFTAVTLMAIACGWEAFEAPGLLRVYAEPLPRSRESLRCPMTLRMIFPTVADLEMMKRSHFLRHSIYDYPSVQDFLTTWILSFVSHEQSSRGSGTG